MASTASSEDTRRAANLRFLQRLDPAIVDILGSASHTVLYKWDDVTQTWEQCDVEGTLFVVQRSIPKHYQFVISNRSTTENVVTAIAQGELQMQLRPPFLIYRCGNKDTRGIWMNNDIERSTIYELIQELLTKELEPPTSATLLSPSKVSSSQTAPAQGTPKPKSSPSSDAGAVAAALLSPLSVSAGQNSTEGMILDKKNLQLTLLSLVQDERFMDLIHAQYIKVAKARAANNPK